MRTATTDRNVIGSFGDTSTRMATQDTCNAERGNQPNHEPNRNLAPPLREDQPDDVARSSAHCHAQPNLTRALADGVRNHRVQPDRSEKKCAGGKDREQDYEDPYVQVVVCDAVFQSSHVVNGQILAMMPSSSNRCSAG